MTHDDLQDLLEGYVNETLDRTTRAEVDRHLAGCDECRAILDGVPAVQLGLIQPAAFDEKAMRRAVRTTLFRLAVNVVVIGLVGWLVLMLVGFLVFQPFIVNRGGRAEAATQATQDLAVMYNPGAALTQTQHNSGIISRTSEATVVFPIGTEMVDLGTLGTRIGPFSFGAEDGGLLFPYLTDSGGIDAAIQLSDVGSGTVATVELQFDSPISLGRAQQLADSPLDVRVVWAGFPTADGDSHGLGLEDGGIVGYSTCDIRSVDSILLGASSAGSGWSPFTDLPSIDRALDATRASIANLVDHGDLIAGVIPGVTRDSVRAAGDYLAGDPGVEILVVTGPSPELVRFLDEADPHVAGVRGIEFTNWYQPLCGR
ncbi:MAG: zf-HC2 domain-containing protein [Acidimicrobiia bacterium]|nr:zf-HC2 domain-containing protein [Acidimicrobiia bacterium]